MQWIIFLNSIIAANTLKKLLFDGSPPTFGSLRYVSLDFYYLYKYILQFPALIIFTSLLLSFGNAGGTRRDVGNDQKCENQIYIVITYYLFKYMLRELKTCQQYFILKQSNGSNISKIFSVTRMHRMCRGPRRKRIIIEKNILKFHKL